MTNIDASKERRDLRTPLARARGIGSGKSGTEHFWRQRVTAIQMRPVSTTVRIATVQPEA